MDTVLAILLGVSLAAATGLRVFLPLLVLSIAAHAGWLELSDSFAFVGSTSALISLSIATAVEIGAYYIPWVDNALDAIASPLAVVAGTVAAGSQMHGADPMVAWTAGAVVGGGAAAAVQTGTVALRAASTLTTGGVANPAVATTENVGAAGISIAALVLPLITGLVVLLVLGLAIVWFIQRRRRVPAT